MYNKEFLKKPFSKYIVSNAIYLLNSSNFKERIYNNDFYETLLSKYASHALSFHNRRFIFVPYSSSFIPLYYDGMFNVPNNWVDEYNVCNSTDNLDKLQKFKSEYEFLSKKFEFNSKMYFQ